MPSNGLDLAAKLNRVSADLAATSATENNLGAIKDLCIDGFQSIAEHIVNSTPLEIGPAPAPQVKVKKPRKTKQSGE